MEKATVCIWMLSGVFTTLGVGHAAIKLETKEGEKHYITWSAQGNPLNAPFKVQKIPDSSILGPTILGTRRIRMPWKVFLDRKNLISKSICRL